MNLLSLLLKIFMSKKTMEALTKKTGSSKKQMTLLLMAAIPILLKFLTQNASSKEGAQSLLGALTQHKETGSIANQIKNADDTDGSKIIDHILGKERNDVVENLAKESGMEGGQVNSILSTIAPALMSGLSAATSTVKEEQGGAIDFGSLLGNFTGAGKQEDDGVFGLDDIVGMLAGGGQAQQQPSVGMNLMSQLFGGGQQAQAQQGGGVLDLFGSLLGASGRQAEQQGDFSGVIASLMKGGLDNDKDTSAVDGTELLSVLTSLMQ
ncbi:MAG: DUF937 domain-containing protein [Eubacteriales bacterium]|nr:DUF937 domain-containing protein [Eubacteriales bacterium]